MALETDTLSNQDLTSEVIVGSYTTTKAGWLGVEFSIAQLNAAAATITARLIVGGVTKARYSEPKYAAADTTWSGSFSPVWVESGVTVTLGLKSSNSSDTTTPDTTVLWADGDQANMTHVSGDSAAADNLELDYDGTGYAKANSTIGTCTANTDMRGTNSAALASVCTETRLAELDAGNLPSDVDEILADTGTDGVKLADDAITSGKYDESTAFPLKSADTGATQVARTGSDSDTLETLSDEIAAQNDFDPASDTVAHVTLVDATTTLTTKTGFALTSAYDAAKTAATQTSVNAIATILTGITSLANWLRLAWRKDASIATDAATELAEINADGGSGAGAFDNTTDSEEAIADGISGVGGVTGAGSLDVTLTVEDGASNPIDGVVVWISTDEAGANVVVGPKYTNAMGLVTFKLDAGTYWMHRQLAGVQFDVNPKQITVS